jgi:SulP family sulfate permease
MKGDIFGGLTAAVVALPLALAFGVSSGAGPIAGLYGAIFVGFFSALFGGTPSQVSGPTGPMTVVMALIFTDVAALVPGDPATALVLAFTIVVMGGAFQVLFGFLKIGRYINLIPAPVISGFMTGIGVIIILLQIAPMTGNSSAASPLNAFLSIPAYLSNINNAALLLSALTLVIVFGLPKAINRILPSPLLALVVGTLVALLLMSENSVSVLGSIPSGLPEFIIPSLNFALLPFMVKSAIILAVLGSLDSLLTSLVADNLTRTHHKSDKELIGQGIGNMVSGLFGGLPGAGATMRTVVNIRAGGSTRISGMTHAVILLIIVLGAGKYAEQIPHAVLAGILIKVGTDIIDWAYLKRIAVAPRAGVIMMLSVLFLTVFVDLITAVGTGVVMASLILVNRMTNLQLSNVASSQEPDEQLKLSDIEKQTMKECGHAILLFSFGGPITFGAAKGVVQKFSQLSAYEILVLDFNDVSFLDYSATMAVSDIIEQAMESGKGIVISGMSGPIESTLDKLDVLESVKDNDRFNNREQAIQFAGNLHKKSSFR